LETLKSNTTLLRVSKVRAESAAPRHLDSNLHLVYEKRVENASLSGSPAPKSK
jgi:hypothetical protein